MGSTVSMTSRGPMTCGGRTDVTELMLLTVKTLQQILTEHKLSESNNYSQFINKHFSRNSLIANSVKELKNIEL